MQGNICKLLVEKEMMVLSQRAKHMQTSGCATATTAVTSDSVNGKFLEIPKVPRVLETLILSRARNWSYLEFQLIQLGKVLGHLDDDP